MTNITILGAGFGALTIVRALRRRRIEADITAIAPRDELHDLPSVHWLKRAFERHYLRAFR